MLEWSSHNKEAWITITRRLLLLILWKRPSWLRPWSKKNHLSSSAPRGTNRPAQVFVSFRWRGTIPPRSYPTRYILQVIFTFSVFLFLRLVCCFGIREVDVGSARLVVTEQLIAADNRENAAAIHLWHRFQCRTITSSFRVKRGRRWLHTKPDPDATLFFWNIKKFNLKVVLLT